MNGYPFKKMDAFATSSSSGNPAGMVALERIGELSEDQMQRIARELKGYVSEVGFIARIAPDAFKMRYFSSETEVQFCGHATIGIMHDRILGDPSLAALPRLLLHTNKGILPVENRLREEGAVYIHAPVPVYTECLLDLAEVCDALSLQPGSVDPSIELGNVNAGNQTLCVPLKTAEDVAGVHPDFERLLAFCQSHRLDVVTVFSRAVADPANHLRTRVFAAPLGYLEDPATGSGNAALGYHLHRLGLWDGSPIRIEQNADLRNPNIVRLASVPDAEHGIRVIFGGGAVLKIDGKYWI